MKHISNTVIILTVACCALIAFNVLSTIKIDKLEDVISTLEKDTTYKDVIIYENSDIYTKLKEENKKLKAKISSTKRKVKKHNKFHATYGGDPAWCQCNRFR